MAGKLMVVAVEVKSTLSMETNASSKSASLILVPHACSSFIPSGRELLSPSHA
jgi:hypothetical protein